MWLVCFVAIAAAGCDDPLPPEVLSIRPPLPAAVVSNAALRDSASPPVAFVSLRPGLILGVQEVTIRNARTGIARTVQTVSGGFDPVAVAAEVGDTLEMDIRVAGDTVLTFGLVVPERRPPVVVRTDPPPRKRDVPLNATMLVVFSEPVDSATLPAGVQLFRNGRRVTGRLEFADAARLTVSLIPDAPLGPSTEHELVISEAIRDLDADALTNPGSVLFITEGCGGMPNSVAIVTVSLTADCSQPDVVAAPGEAVVVVAPGGIVQLESGGLDPFVVVDSIDVAKPIVFRSADGGSPIVDVRSKTGFRVTGVDSGTVSFTGITFLTSAGTYAAIFANGYYDQVAIEGSTFRVAGTAGVFGGASAISGARVMVRNNTFSFLPNSIEGFHLGMIGVFAAGLAAIDIIGNQVTGPMGWAAFQFQNGAAGRIEGNVLTQCGGRQGCVNVRSGTGLFGGGPAPGSTVMGNTISTPAGGISLSAIDVSGTATVVTGNLVAGEFGGGDRADSTQYGYLTGIRIRGGANLVIDGNSVSGAMRAIDAGSFGPAVQSLRDNLISTVGTAFSGTFGTNALSRNDITDYLIPFSGGFGTGALACNWWGNAAGPQNVPVGADPAIYTPWATAPIARGAGGSCVGGGPRIR